MEEAFFGKPVSSYSRSKAIEEGMLVDVSTTAIEAGFNFPVALTRRVWDQYVMVPNGVECQDQKGRLWDILYMLNYAIRSRNKAESSLIFTLHVRNDNRKPKPVRLKSVCGPGDDSKPVITIMLPDED